MIRADVGRILAAVYDVGAQIHPETSGSSSHARLATPEVADLARRPRFVSLAAGKMVRVSPRLLRQGREDKTIFFTRILCSHIHHSHRRQRFTQRFSPKTEISVMVPLSRAPTRP